MTTQHPDPARASQAAADAQALALQAQGIDDRKPWPRSPYEVNLPALQGAFGEPIMDHAGAPFHKRLQLGQDGVSVPNVTRHDAAHADTINILPYDNAAGQRQHIAGEPVRGRPCELLVHADVGDVFWGVSHMNFQHRAQGSDLESIKQHMTHVRIYTVVDLGRATGRVDKGVAVMDFPRSYAESVRGSDPDPGQANGLINTRAYPSTLYRLAWPDAVSPGARRAYRDNIRSWAVLVNKIGRFPGGRYNGNDRLGTHDLERVREFGARVLSAMDKDEQGRPTAGARDALAWLQRADQQLYCAEGAVHLALNLGLNLPLNEAVLAPQHWRAFQRLLQAGEQRFWSREYPDAYPLDGNGHPGGPPSDQESPHSRYTRQIAITDAPAWLEPVDRLAFRPWDAVDMIEQFLRRIVPREQLAAGALDDRAQAVATAQADLFMGTKAALAPVTQDLGAQARAGIDRLFQHIDGVLRRPDGKQSLDRALQGPIATARASVRGDREAGAVLFVPPNRVANPDPDDFIRFEEVGQWVHRDFVRSRD